MTEYEIEYNKFKDFGRETLRFMKENCRLTELQHEVVKEVLSNKVWLDGKTFPEANSSKADKIGHVDPNAKYRQFPLTFEECYPPGQKFSDEKVPLYTVMFKQFPNALQAVAKCSHAGHKKYKETDQDYMNFLRVPNPEHQYKNAAIRHMMESGVNQDMLEYGECLHEAQAVWNLLCALEIKLRQNE